MREISDSPMANVSHVCESGFKELTLKQVHEIYIQRERMAGGVHSKHHDMKYVV